jgi:hypothetical protein
MSLYVRRKSIPTLFKRLQTRLVVSGQATKSLLLAPREHGDQSKVCIAKGEVVFAIAVAFNDLLAPRSRTTERIKTEASVHIVVHLLLHHLSEVSFLALMISLEIVNSCKDAGMQSVFFSVDTRGHEYIAVIEQSHWHDLNRTMQKEDLLLLWRPKRLVAMQEVPELFSEVLLQFEISTIRVDGVSHLVVRWMMLSQLVV